MTGHTTALTAEEIKDKRKLRPFNDLQAACLRASLRTGQRYGLTIGKGVYVYDLVLTGYRLTAKGKATGTGKVETLQTGLTWEQAIAALDALEGPAADPSYRQRLKAENPDHAEEAAAMADRFLDENPDCAF